MEVGFRLDRYEVLALLAQGGMGAVWLARLEGKHGFEKLVALKTILPEYAADERFRGMFLDEARIASKIAHPNVAQILDLGEEDGVLYHVMEWVDGDSLKTLHRMAVQKTEAFPVPVALRLVADACAGLHAAHELRDAEGRLLDVVHRDVSPHNVLVSTQGVAKVTDFGIAKARGRVSGNTTGTVRGKIHYMAPEQASGKPVDRRADVWALGATLYELCAGRPPFDAENEVAALHLLLTTPPAFHFGTERVPDAVTSVLKRALSRVPAARYDTAYEMRVALEAAMHAASMRASEEDVAAFVRTHLGARADARRAAVERAIDAAEARRKARDAGAPIVITPGAGRPIALSPAAGVAAVGGSTPPGPVSGRAATVEVPIEASLPGGSTRLELATTLDQRGHIAEVRAMSRRSPPRRPRLRPALLALALAAPVAGVAWLAIDSPRAGLPSDAGGRGRPDDVEVAAPDARVAKAALPDAGAGAIALDAPDAGTGAISLDAGTGAISLDAGKRRPRAPVPPRPPRRPDPDPDGI